MMTNQAILQGNDDASANSVRKTVMVQAPQEIAFRVFTEKLGTWWPLGSHKIGKTKAVDAVIEPRQGGRWYERGDDGSTCTWGKVLAWEPHARLVLTWQVSADWQPDPNVLTEVEVHFIAEGADRTRVELEHRNFDAYGARQAELRAIFESENGWKGVLAQFAERARART
ncbi:SRPBCC family protein [Pendulispora albinea]|uniref:SRPBCC family protein n=1 Tax=Pendulispora albinea TaxID=2741071 RepID=A0ABZ2M4M4_9BACT